MRTLAEQIAGKCCHFSGIGPGLDKSCKAGVVYMTVESTDKTRKGFSKYPCFREGEGVPCEKRHFPTNEEVSAEVAEHDASMERLMFGMKAVHADAKIHGYGKGNGGKGKVVCPVCKTGDLHYSVAGYNGHIWGQCDTKDCISWMQ